MGIGVDPFRVLIGQVFQEGIQYVRGFISAAGDKAAEQSDVVIRYVPVSNTPGLAVPDVVFGQQVVFIGLKVSTIRGGGIPGTPS